MMSIPTLSKSAATAIGVNGTRTGRLGRVAQIRQALHHLRISARIPVPPVVVIQLTVDFCLS